MEPQCAPSDRVERHDEHTDQPLFGVAQPEEHGRDEHPHDEPSASTPDRLLEPRQQVAAIGEFFSERSKGPTEYQQDGKHPEVALQAVERSKVLLLS